MVSLSICLKVVENISMVVINGNCQRNFFKEDLKMKPCRVMCLLSFYTLYPSVFHQQQSGLISRVTDTVKSIVPSWLQKYFNNEDGPEGGGPEQGRDQNCQLSPSPPSLQPPNGNEEGPPVDGRDSPEPSTSNTGE